MAHRMVLLAAAAAVFGLWLSGCSQSVPGSPSGATGGLAFRVAWPEAVAEVIPAATTSIALEVIDTSQSDPWAGGTILSTVLTRDNPQASVDGLRPGTPWRATATAYADQGGWGGVTIATGAVTGTIAAGEVTPVALMMNSTVSAVDVQPEQPAAFVGGTVQLTATATDSASNVLVVAPGAWTWASSVPGRATVDSSGMATGVSMGRSLLTATYSEDPAISPHDSVQVSVVGLWGTWGSGPGQLDIPGAIATDSDGNVLVTEVGNDRVQVFDADGQSLRTWGTNGSDNGQFTDPGGVAVGRSGYVYVLDSGNYRVQKFTSIGGFLRAWGQLGYEGSPGQFVVPAGIAVDLSENVYVTDASLCTVQKFDCNGVFLASWGAYGTANGQFSGPQGISVDRSGNVYVADSGNSRIQKFGSSGTFVAKWGPPGSGPGEFYGPTGVVADSSGNVWVADAGNCRIQKLTDTGTFVAQWGTGYWGNAAGQLGSSFSIGVAEDGRVYVAERDEHRVQCLLGSFF